MVPGSRGWLGDGRAPALPEDTAPSAPAAARVLVVDDDTMVREMLTSQMEEMGYRVAQASDGLEALAHLDGGAAVDLLISDFAMPGMNGLRLIHEARRRRPELPALLLTGYADAGVQLALEDARRGARRCSASRCPARHWPSAQRPCWRRAARVFNRVPPARLARDAPHRFSGPKPVRGHYPCLIFDQLRLSQFYPIMGKCSRQAPANAGAGRRWIRTRQCSKMGMSRRAERALSRAGRSLRP